MGGWVGATLTYGKPCYAYPWLLYCIVLLLYCVLSHGVLLHCIVLLYCIVIVWYCMVVYRVSCPWLDLVIMVTDMASLILVLTIVFLVLILDWGDAWAMVKTLFWLGLIFLDLTGGLRWEPHSDFAWFCWIWGMGLGKILVRTGLDFAWFLLDLRHRFRWKPRQDWAWLYLIVLDLRHRIGQKYC